MNTTQDQLIGIVKKIAEVNPKAILSGSLALNLQMVNTMREPKDIDILIPYGVPFNSAIPGISHSMDYGDNGEYDDEGWSRRGFKIDGYKLDVFTPEEPEVFDYLIDFTVVRGGFKCVNALDIMKFKLSHAFSDVHTKWKHRDDLMFMLLANYKLQD